MRMPHLIVVNKPAGMVVHPAAGHASGTLVNALLHHVSDLSGIGGELRPGIVHRLDRGTSGLMVVAKHDRGPRMTRAAVPRSRGREGIPRAGLGRRPGRTSHRSGDRPRPRPAAEDVGQVQTGALGSDAHHARATPQRRDAHADCHLHGTHTPDPRAPERDRPPNRGGWVVWWITPAGASRSPADPPPGTAIPARRTACVQPSHRGAAPRVHRRAAARPADGPGRDSAITGARRGRVGAGLIPDTRLQAPDSRARLVAADSPLTVTCEQTGPEPGAWSLKNVQQS